METAKVVPFNTALSQEKVDRLGVIKSQIAELEIEEKKLADELKALGVGVYAGQFYDANVFSQLREVVDWKAIAEKVGYSTQLKTAHTRQNEVVVCKVGARIGVRQ